jgi:hypothetical protein
MHMTHKTNEDIQSAILYKEELSEYVAFGTYYKSYNQIIRQIWIVRLMALSFIALFCWLSRFIDWYDWRIILIVFSVLMLFILSEVFEAKKRSSATPIIIKEDKIRLYSLPIQRLLGYNGFVSKDDVESIIIRRHSCINEVISDRREGRIIRWENAPVEFIIHTIGGTNRRSGIKHPQKISTMVEIMSSAWGIRVFDENGNQLLSSIKYKDGYDTLQ